MNQNLKLSLALAAGLLGGLLSRYIAPTPVLAQTQPQRGIRAQSFILVEDQNNVIGTFKSSDLAIHTSPTVVLEDRNGREIWRAGVSMKTLAER